jgi:hypothetical protein
MKTLSKRFYVSAPIVGAVSLLLVGLVISMPPAGDLTDLRAGWILVFVVGIFGCIYAIVVSLVFIYKMWQPIADEHARTTPGKAVGFLFIPFFNLYWIFQVLCGFAKDCNAYIERRSLTANKLPEGLFLACAILLLCSGFPPAGVACAVVFAIVISKTCDTINAFDQTGKEDVGALTLHFLSGEYSNDSLELPANGLTIGRDPSKANLIFKSPKISALHAKLMPNGHGQVWVEDMNSINGTFYRQQRAGGQNIGWDWMRIRGQLLLAAGARLRLADDVGEFEIRKP